MPGTHRSRQAALLVKGGQSVQAGGWQLGFLFLDRAPCSWSAGGGGNSVSSPSHAHLGWGVGWWRVFWFCLPLYPLEECSVNVCKCLLSA